MKNILPPKVTCVLCNRKPNFISIKIKYNLINAQKCKNVLT